MEIFFVERVNFGKDLPLPKYETKHASGIDLYAAISKIIILKPRQRELITSGIKIKIPENFEGQVRPRSGLALKYGVTVLNSPGTIDADFRGEIGIILINHGNKNFLIKPKMRIFFGPNRLTYLPVTNRPINDPTIKSPTTSPATESEAWYSDLL